VNVWSRQGGIDDGALLAELPANLRTDVSLFMNSVSIISHQIDRTQNTNDTTYLGHRSEDTYVL